ncbi:TPA: hypothetical protein SMF55_004865 [Serratia liquefaciens]|nr:hypothetical protein [Serratia liquefaciens]
MRAKKKLENRSYSEMLKGHTGYHLPTRPIAEWRKMSSLMQRENAVLSESVTSLRGQIQSLSKQLRQL